MMESASSNLDPVRLTVAADAIVAVATDEGGRIDLRAEADRPPRLSEFTRDELHEAVAFLIRLGVIELANRVPNETQE